MDRQSPAETTQTTRERLRAEVLPNAPACEALDRIEAVLARLSPAEQDAFWRAVDLYYVSRKAPGEETAATEPETGE